MGVMVMVMVVGLVGVGLCVAVVGWWEALRRL